MIENYKPPSLVWAKYFIALRITGPPNQPTADPYWPTYSGRLPEDQPHNAVALIGTEGNLDGRLMKTGQVIRHPGIEVIVRCNRTNYDAAYVKIGQIEQKVNDTVNVTVPTDNAVYKILAATQTSQIINPGVDELDRFLLSFNFTCTLQKIS